MGLVDTVIEKRKNHKEELEREVADGMEFEEGIIDVGRIEPRKPRAPRRQQTPKKAKVEKNGAEWGMIRRLADTYCTIMETPQVSKRLNDETFNEVIESTLLLFRQLCDRYTDDIDE